MISFDESLSMDSNSWGGREGTVLPCRNTQKFSKFKVIYCLNLGYILGLTHNKSTIVSETRKLSISVNGT